MNGVQNGSIIFDSEPDLLKKKKRFKLVDKTEDYEPLNEDDYAICGFLEKNSFSDHTFISWKTESNKLLVHDDGTNRILNLLILEDDAKISCVASCWANEGEEGLLLGVNNDKGSFVAFYCVRTGRILSVHQLPQGEITSLEVVLDASCVVAERKQRFHPALQAMNQICVAGTTQGHAFIFDIGLRRRGTVVSSFNDPTRLKSVAYHELAFSPGSCTDLISYFQWQGHYSFPLEDHQVFVSRIKFCDPSALVAIGLNCGDILLFSLTTGLAMKPISGENPSEIVKDICVQEPENDPKPTLFLWIASNSDDEEVKPSLKLIQLSFDEKSFQTESGPFYNSLSAYAVKLQHELDECKRIVSCRTISVDDRHIRHDDSSNIRGNREDTSQMVVLWEEENGDLAGGVFDLNGWYLAQMPAEVRFTPYLSSFLSRFRLKMTSSQDATIPAAKDFLVLGDTMWRFSTGWESDVFYYPSAVSFSAQLATSEGVFNVKIESVQNQILDSFEEELKDRKGTWNEFGKELGKLESFGLLNSLSASPPSHINGVKCQLLGMFMHAKRTDVLRRFLTSPLIPIEDKTYIGREWIWKMVEDMKNRFDIAVRSLFDLSGSLLSKLDKKQANHCLKVVSDLESLHQLYIDILMENVTADLSDLKCKQEAIHLVREYIQMTLWFLDREVLPETIAFRESLREIEVNFRKKKETHGRSQNPMGPSTLFP